MFLADGDALGAAASVAATLDQSSGESRSASGGRMSRSIGFYFCAAAGTPVLYAYPRGAQCRAYQR
jgi:hypothetical protein